MQKQRRDFLKITAAGAAGLALTRADRAFAAWPGTGTMAVNPNIDNMRVVGCVGHEDDEEHSGDVFRCRKCGG